jgi:hypothetical protein
LKVTVLFALHIVGAIAVCLVMGTIVSKRVRRLGHDAPTYEFLAEKRGASNFYAKSPVSSASASLYSPVSDKHADDSVSDDEEQLNTLHSSSGKEKKVDLLYHYGH